MDTSGWSKAQCVLMPINCLTIDWFWVRYSAGFRLRQSINFFRWFLL